MMLRFVTTHHSAFQITSRSRENRSGDVAAIKGKKLERNHLTVANVIRRHLDNGGRKHSVGSEQRTRRVYRERGGIVIGMSTLVWLREDDLRSELYKVALDLFCQLDEIERS